MDREEESERKGQRETRKEDWKGKGKGVRER